MLSHILRNIIEVEFDTHCYSDSETNVVGDTKRRKYGLQVDFSFTKNRTCALLVYGEYKYIGIYTKFAKDLEWSVQGYHDSCWRDSLETWLINYEREFSTLYHWPMRSLHKKSWRTIIEPTDEQVKTLRLARKKRYGE